MLDKVLDKQLQWIILTFGIYMLRIVIYLHVDCKFDGLSKR